MIDRKIRIPVPPLFSFKECLWFLNRDYDDCLHRIDSNSITKAIRLHNQEIIISVTANEQHIEVSTLHGDINAELATKITHYIHHWFDLQTDIEPFYKLLQKNKHLEYMRESFYGLRAIGIPDIFEALIWSITGQQINLRFAYTLKRRLTETYGTTLSYNDIPFYIFPTPAILALLDIEDLRKMQFSTSKSMWIINIAKAFVNGDISGEKLSSLPDFESRQKALIQFKGIGTWTANYVLMKTMRDMTAVPSGDIGLLNALSNHSIIKTRDETSKIEKLFKQFSGWESYLVFYLWRSLANPEQP